MVGVTIDALARPQSTKVWDNRYYAGLRVRPYATVALDLIAERDEIVYLINRDSQFAEVTLSWLLHHEFPPGELEFGDIERALTKVDVLVTTSFREAQVASAHQIDVYYLGDCDPSESIHPVADWAAFIEYLNQ